MADKNSTYPEAVITGRYFDLLPEAEIIFSVNMKSKSPIRAMRTSKQKLNCWEFQGCGREPGGVNVSECGICPSSTETRLDSVHGGRNAGRACWVVGGTMCSGYVRGTLAKKHRVCSLCDFYLLLREEEDHRDVIPTYVLLEMLEDL